MLILFAGMQIFVFGQEDENLERTERSLVGTWQTSVTPRNCQTGDPVAPAFPGILTFNDGGTMTGTSTAVSSVYGIWAKMRGWRNNSLAFLSLRYSPTGALSERKKSGKQLLLEQTAMNLPRPVRSKSSTQTGTLSEWAARPRREFGLNKLLMSRKEKN